MQMQLIGVIDPSEAPPGYYAMPKSDAAKETKGANICRACDWRSHCNGLDHRCMSYEVVANNGQVLCRNDGCSVVFKKKPEAA